MNKVVLKVCGLTDARVAKQAIQMGVQQVGLVFHPTSKRFITLPLAQKIADAVHEENGSIVPVFVDQHADEILAISEQIAADVVQLHGISAIKAYTTISPYYACIIAARLCSSVDFANSERDFLIYDSLTPGSGCTMDWQALKTDDRFRFFIAGGLNRDNIIAARDYFHPFGLDISSGVERAPGVKDSDLIKEIVEQI